MSTTLGERKAAAMERLMALDTARRGQLSTQYYTRRVANGRVVRNGPYYVWQRYVKGKKCSVRVSSEQIERVQADLKRGLEAEAVIEELWTVLEQTSMAEDQDSKKKSKWSKRPGNAKRKPSST